MRPLSESRRMSGREGSKISASTEKLKKRRKK